MAYTALTFVAGEVLTATKMNALSANDASLSDGSGLLAKSVTLAKLNGGSTAGVLATNASGVVASAAGLFGGDIMPPGVTTKSFTPAIGGLLEVTARARRNSATAADISITISATGTSLPKTATVAAYGTSDGFLSAHYLAKVSAGIPVVITINATGGSVINSYYTFRVDPGNYTEV